MAAISGMIVDGVLAALLMAAIVACVMVYRRLGTIRAGQAELKLLVDRLNSAATEAQRSVAGLRTSADEIELRLANERQKASVMADELSMITEAGNNLADRIEKGLVGENERVSAQNDQGESVKAAGNKQQREILAALREAR